MGADPPGRLQYLEATRALLWPDEPGAAESSVDMVVLPSRNSARLLSPARPRRAAASAAMRYSAQQDMSGRVKGLALAGGIQLGLLGRGGPVRLAVRGPASSINDHLESVLGQPVLTSLALTHDRANRKPVLQVFDARGRTIAFAKVGVNDLTRRLVDAEAAALTDLAGRDLAHVRVPAVLDHRRWNDLAVLVMSPLPALSVRAPGLELIELAMREVAFSAVTDTGSAAGPYVAGLRARAATMIGDPHLRRWCELLEAEVHARDNTELTFGAWHGDWARWNFLARGKRLAVWDWERYSRPAPVGFDRLHYFLQANVGSHRDRFATGAPMMVDCAPQLLAGWSMSPRAARTTALLYLLDISLRYLADDQRATGGGGAVETWAFPTLAAGLDL